MNQREERFQTGIPALDRMLGGGLLPGTMTVVLGATGIGKTQLGLHFARQGTIQEGEAGIVFDMTSRGDSQRHAEYARRLFGWELDELPALDGRTGNVADHWKRHTARSDSLHLFRKSGRRVTMRDLNADEQREWKIELNRKLEEVIRFFYGNFVQGVRRCVIDGIEPVEQSSDSFQFELLEYIYHQIIRKDCQWVARDLLREAYRDHAEQVSRHPYDASRTSCLVLCTTREVLLDDLLIRNIEAGDILSNAATILLMGKTLHAGRLGRALHIAKHRGSVCDDRIVSFTLSDRGLELDVD